jgi:hypothetical protein
VVPVAAHAVVPSLGRRVTPTQKGEESLLKDVLGLPVGEPQRPTVENQLGGLLMIQGFTPPYLFNTAHKLKFNQIDTECLQFVYKNPF